jgi:hypothetical protein
LIQVRNIFNAVCTANGNKAALQVLLLDETSIETVDEKSTALLIYRKSQRASLEA